MLGHWKDYDELESSLSMPELILTLESMHKVEKRKQKFMAAMQGIDLDETEDKTEESNKPNKPATVEEIQAKAIARLSGDPSLANAMIEGFTPESGLEYKIVGGTDIG